MTDYKLVPVEPAGLTDEQIFSIAEPFGAFEFGDAQGDKTLAFARAILAAAPVQGEPVATIPVDGWRVRVPLRCSMDVYAAPQPAGAALPPEITREMLGMIIDEVFGGGIEDASVIEDIYRVIARSAAPQPEEQQPDVAGLVEALEQCITSMLDSGYRADAVVIRAARTALAAYRKQGGEK